MPNELQDVVIVYVAVADRAGVVVRELKLDGNREAVRTESVTAVLQLLTDSLRALPARL